MEVARNMNNEVKKRYVKTLLKYRILNLHLLI